MGDLHRVLGPAHATAVALGALCGAGVVFVPRRVENLAGPATPVAFLLATTGALALAVCWAVFLAGPTGDRPGGAYRHLARTWDSEALAFAVVWTKPAAYVGLLALLAAWLGDWLARAVGGGSPILSTPAADQWAVGLLALLTALHLAGVRWPARLQLVVTGALSALLLGMLLPGLPAIVPGNFVPLLPTESLRADPVGAVGDATLVALFGVVGVEVVANLAGETRGSRRWLPRVLLGVTLAVGVAVTLIATITLGVIPWTRLVFATVPFADAAASYLRVRASLLAEPAILLATAGGLLAFSWAPTRLLYDLGDLLPPLSRTNRHGAPDVAVLTTTVPAAALVVTDTTHLALYLALPGLFGLYLCHGVTAAALPRADPAGFSAGTTGVRADAGDGTDDGGADATAPLLHRRPALLVVAGLTASGLAALCLALVVTRDPATTLGWLRVAPALSILPEGTLVRDPATTVLPATLGWLTVGALVWLTARDYRLSREPESDSDRDTDRSESPARPNTADRRRD
ncbi:APC family permease [Salinirubrum litoreum]|uniref:APC family permease n=1 Tax=Salinirubrum litoreum TaxID=1126234 RepID=A0ABD5RA48_9EURY|nr:APC family permease [Salinirubrum litoreum]